MNTKNKSKELKNGEMLVVEVKDKGKGDRPNRAKREFLEEWVSVVNAHGGFGR